MLLFCVGCLDSDPPESSAPPLLPAMRGAEAVEVPDVPETVDQAEIIDDQGRVSYVVTLRPDALRELHGARQRDARFATYHTPAAGALVRTVEGAHGVTATAMASRVTLAFSTYLRDEQVAALAADPRVARVEKNLRVPTLRCRVERPTGDAGC